VDSTCGSHANNNTVKGNTINDSGGTVGINIFVCTGQTYPCQADSSVLESNTITGYSTPIGDGGTNTVIKNNTATASVRATQRSAAVQTVPSPAG
jgi:hypothetical protein